MIGTVMLRQDPQATLALVSFIAAGIVGCLLRLWWLWWTLCPQECCQKPARECRCRSTS